MERRLALALTVAGAVATTVLAIDLGGCSTDSGGTDGGGHAGLSCQLGGTCSPTQICAGGIVGCNSNCQCVGGTWQAPCPVGVPPRGSSCTAEGATCGYVMQTTCGSVDCYCRGGAWACEPSCNAPPDAGPDAAGCIAAGGECLNPNVICAVPGSLSCGAVYPGAPYCCMSNVADCGQPGATTYVCPPAQEGGMTCTSAPVPLGAPNYQALVQATDNDASYPVGCRVTFPACNNGHVPYCTCSSDTATWNCF